MADEGFHTVRDRVRPELVWFLRHKTVLERWPVLPEPWAAALEARRRAEVDPPGRDISFLHGAGR
ncbi:MAG: hypothetical protein ACOYL4_00665 [Miltoncostaeaceae bacterium]